MPWLLALIALLLATATTGCDDEEKESFLPPSKTFAELRTIRSGVSVKPPGEESRAPYPRERLADGAEVELSKEASAWIRRDRGLSLFCAGAAELTVRSDRTVLRAGRAYVEAPSRNAATLVVGTTALRVAGLTASVEVDGDAATVDVLTGAFTIGDTTVVAGERARLDGDAITVDPVVHFDDWTGGLASADRVAQPAPYGVGTVGARPPGDAGRPREPLTITEMRAHVSVIGDLAITEIEQTFFNPSGETVEGIYRFRTPPHAVLHRFGVDRDGEVVWGYIKEAGSAERSYQEKVYRGSTEDPALLTWEAPGELKARLYPIEGGAHRTVVVRYGQWLPRAGAKGERRLYVLPIAAEGAEESLPWIEEFALTVDVREAGATDVRVGMDGIVQDDVVSIRAFDWTPRADIAVELYDAGLDGVQAYRAPHVLDEVALAPEELEQRKDEDDESDYLMVPLRLPEPNPGGGLDVGIVVDTSAATAESTLALSAQACRALLARLDERDRVAIWTGDDGLAPVGDDDGLTEATAGARATLEDRLGTLRPGGASDLGEMLASAALALDPKRQGVIIYVGDGRATVGESTLEALAERLEGLARPPRILALGVGDDPNMGLLKGISRGGHAHRATSPREVSLAALTLLEQAQRPVHESVKVDLGPGVDRLTPASTGLVPADETLFALGRVVGDLPDEITVTVDGDAATNPLSITPLADSGDLSRRWAERKLDELLAEGAEHATLVDLGVRHAIMTPVTAFYVPTDKELDREQRALRKRKRPLPAAPKSGRWSGGNDDDENTSDRMFDGRAKNDEGGTGQRARGDTLGDDEDDDRGDPEPEEYEEDEKAKETASANAAKPAPSTVAAQPEAPSELEPAFADGDDEKQALKRQLAEAPNDILVPPAPPPPSPWPIGGKQEDKSLPSSSASAATKSGEALPSTDEPIQQGMDGDAWGIDNSLTDLPHGAGGGDGFGYGANTDGTELLLEGSGTLARDEAAEFGMIGLLANERTRAPGARVVIVSELPRGPFGCGAGATSPLPLRIQLWKERLAKATGSPSGVEAVYRGALWRCEAPTFRERSVLYTLMLDALPEVELQVALWRSLFDDVGASDALYRGILARVRSADEKRRLAQALNLTTVDPQRLEKIAEEPAIERRIELLRELAAIYTQDLELSILLMHTLEDAGQLALARARAEELRRRADVDTRVRTAVGELFLRLAANASDESARKRDLAEAKRAFGEIVEFAPQDPVARRYLGDLLRAHGWFEEAARHYETLAELMPDDPTVAMRLAAAAYGQGKLEEALRFAEQGAESGRPGAHKGPAQTAEAFAATFVGWAKEKARDGSDEEALAKIQKRAGRILRSSEHKGAVRITLIWSHPELRPTLWSNELGGPTPVDGGDPLAGIAAGHVSDGTGRTVQIRVDPKDVPRLARLGAEATLTVVFAEGTSDESIAIRTVAFAPDDDAIKTFALEDLAR